MCLKQQLFKILWGSETDMGAEVASWVSWTHCELTNKESWFIPQQREEIWAHLATYLIGASATATLAWSWLLAPSSAKVKNDWI